MVSVNIGTRMGAKVNYYKMEQTIKINFRNATCDIEIKELSLNNISNLSTLPQAVAEQLASSLKLIYKEADKQIEDNVNLLLQGKTDILQIL